MGSAKKGGKGSGPGQDWTQDPGLHRGQAWHHEPQPDHGQQHGRPQENEPAEEPAEPAREPDPVPDRAQHSASGRPREPERRRRRARVVDRRRRPAIASRSGAAGGRLPSRRGGGWASRRKGRPERSGRESVAAGKVARVSAPDTARRRRVRRCLRRPVGGRKAPGREARGGRDQDRRCPLLARGLWPVAND